MSAAMVAVQDDLLTPMEVAWRLKCSTSWVYRRVRTGVWESVPTERGLRIPASVIDAWEADKAAGPSRDEIIAEWARQFIAEGQRKGKLPKQLAPATLARIARIVRSVDL
jgi:hypothetical protein